MLRMPHARNLIRTEWKAAIIVLALAGNCCLEARNASQVAVIDLTKNMQPEETTARYPGASSDSYKPDWVLPLSIKHVQVTVVEANDYRVRIKVVNRGAAPFRMPSSVSARTIEANGNRRRRIMLFELEIRDASADKAQIVPIAVAECSDSIPESYFSLYPGQSVDILMPLSGNSLWKLQSVRDPRIRLRITESVLSDSAFFVEAMSAPLISTELICSDMPSGFECH